MTPVEGAESEPLLAAKYQGSFKGSSWNLHQIVR